MQPVTLRRTEVPNQFLLASVWNLLDALPDDSTAMQRLAFMGMLRKLLAERGRRVTDNPAVNAELEEHYERIADRSGIAAMTSAQRLHWLVLSTLGGDLHSADREDPGRLDLVAEILADAGMPDLPANAVAYAGNGTVQFLKPLGAAPNHHTPHMPRIVHNIVTTAAGVQVRDSLDWLPVTPPFYAPQWRDRLPDAVTAVDMTAGQMFRPGLDGSVVVRDPVFFEAAPAFTPAPRRLPDAVTVRIRRGLERFFEDID